MRFLYNNINSVKKHKQEIATIIDIYKPDIVGFNETKRTHKDEENYDIDTDQIIFGNNLHIPRQSGKPKDGKINFQGTSVFSRDTSTKVKYAGSPDDHEMIVFEYKTGKKQDVDCRHYQVYLSPSSNDLQSTEFFNALVNDINTNAK